MILVDTSVWIDHFRYGNEQLSKLLYQGKVVTHDFVIGELACGNLKNRQEILSYMQALPKAINPTHEEILIFIENYKLYGKGLGYIDISLLCSSLLTNVKIWTLDKRLDNAGKLLDINFNW